MMLSIFYTCWGAVHLYNRLILHYLKLPQQLGRVEIHSCQRYWISRLFIKRRTAQTARFTCLVYLAHFIEHLFQLKTENTVVELIGCQQCRVIALLILHWKYIYSPHICFERLMRWWEGAGWSMNGCLCEDKFTQDVNLILTQDGWVDHMTLIWSISYTCSEACATKRCSTQQGGNTLEINGVTIGARMK